VGTHYLFTCPNCVYETEVSGGNDVGMACATSTILCKTCKELFDIETSTEPWLAIERDWKPEKYSCPNSPDHPCRLWKHPGPCPRCGVSMKKVEATLNWD